jgi:tight adherence protein B
VDCPDLNFFVISVLIQRETGGNLAEIIEKIGQLIRERFKLMGMIKALSAEGRLSAIILVVLPLLVFAYLYIAQPSYVLLLVTDPIGQAMASVVLVLMTVGVFMMRRMIRFKI